MTYTYTFTGPRSYADADAVDRAMRDALVAEDAAIRVRVGDCPTGADLFVREWCAANLPARCLEVWRADWKRFGRAAGPIRNAQMIQAKPRADLLVVFWDNSPCLGTRNCVANAALAGIQFWHTTPDPDPAATEAVVQRLRARRDRLTRTEPGL